MAKSLILRNITGSTTVAVPDLGIQIGVGDTLDFTTLIEKDRFLVFASADLRARVSANEIEVIADGVAVPFVDLESFLERFCVLSHKLADDHIGNLPEDRISDDGILARLADDEVVTGSWSFPGGIVLQTGTTMPAIGDAGSVFYNTATNELYVSNGTAWVEYASLDDINTHNHDGVNSVKVDHDNLDNITANQHHNKIHDINSSDHTGLLAEAKIQNGTLLARVADDELITGLYNFSTGGLIMQAGLLVNRPSGAIDAGRLYWATDTKALYVGDGATWVEFTSSADFDAHNHDGVNSPKVDHEDLLNKGTNTHAEIDSHIAETVDPHSDEMTVSTRLITPEVQTTGDMVIDAVDATASTVFFRNTGGGTLKVRIQGDFQYDGTIDQTNLIESLINDNSIVLNSNFTTGVPSTDASLKVRRGDENDAMVNWSEAIDRWQGGVDGAMYTFALIEADESIAGDWDFSGGLIIPKGTTLPSPSDEARIFWKSDSDELYLSDGTSWVKFTSNADFANHDHDGVNSLAVDHNNLDNVTANQHHNQIHDINSADHTGLLAEAKISNDNLLARLADNETVTGDWGFDGSLVIPRANGTGVLPPYEGRFLLDTSDNTLKMGDGTNWQTVAKFGSILSATAGDGLVNSGTTEDPVFDVNVDNATLQIVGDVVSVKAIPESAITDANLLARLADNETITGDWTFNGQLVIPVIAGSTVPTTVVNGGVFELAGTGDAYIGSNGVWEKIMTSANVSDAMRSRIQFSRHGNCNAGTFLMNGDTLVSLTQGVVLATDSVMAGASVINKNVITDGSGVEIFKNGTSVATLDVVNGTLQGYTNTLNVSFVAGDFVSVRLKTTNGSKLKNPQITIELK